MFVPVQERSVLLIVLSQYGVDVVVPVPGHTHDALAIGALTKESAKRAIWPELLAVGRALGIEEAIKHIEARDRPRAGPPW